MFDINLCNIDALDLKYQFKILDKLDDTKYKTK